MPTAYTQSDFSGGMNLFDEPPNIGVNEYGLAFNIRNRSKAPIPVAQVVEDTDIPAGKKQGVYAFDRYVLVFVNGRAYYKDVIDDTDWTQVAGLALDVNVDYIYTQAVPASKLNYDRKLKSATQASGNTSESAINVIPSLSIAGSPYGLVVQDGVNQGYLILPDGTARKLQNYTEWTRSAREYVPIMKQMAYVDGILFGIAAFDKDGNEDGKTILRSVSGRPIDFVVNVDINGNKGGDAYTTSHAVGFDTITCIRPMAQGMLLTATEKSLIPIQLDYENTIFAEPKFRNPESIPAGVVNQFSFVNYLHPDGYSDGYFIDTDGLRSFNSAQIQGNEGRNSVFTSGIKLSMVSKQSVTAAVVFDDYSLFSIKTIHNDDNNLVAVYDNIRRQWVCFDDYGIGSIKMFALAKQSSSPSLYAITEDKLYKLFGSDSVAEASMQFRAVSTGDLSNELQLTDIRAAFINNTDTGIVSATPIVDGTELSQLLTRQRLRGFSRVDNVRFNFAESKPSGYTISPKITWQTSCNLYAIQLDATGNSQETNIKQQTNQFA